MNTPLLEVGNEMLQAATLKDQARVLCQSIHELRSKILCVPEVPRNVHERQAWMRLVDSLETARKALDAVVMHAAAMDWPRPKEFGGPENVVPLREGT